MRGENAEQCQQYKQSRENRNYEIKGKLAGAAGFLVEVITRLTFGNDLPPELAGLPQHLGQILALINRRIVLPWPAWQVLTRPTFFVVTSPACSRTPTCFFMPVRVMWNLSARSVIEASARPSCSRTPRRVTSESAENEQPLTTS